MRRYTKAHAVKMGYPSLSAYKRDNGLTYNTLPQRSKEAIKRLYNVDFTKWVQGFHQAGDIRYVMREYFADYDEARAAGIRKASKFPLNDAALYRHFTGESPLAVFAHGTHARYFGFDVDSGEQAEAHARQLIATLQAEGIVAADIHVSYSGGKGYHIELFTRKHLTFADWTLIGRYIRDQAGLTGEAIEFRPTATNGQAWKLPLTFHPKTGNFAGFVDRDTFEVYSVPASHDYLHAIEQIQDMAGIFAMLKRAKQHEADISQREEEVAAAQADEPDEDDEKASRNTGVTITEFDLFKSAAEKRDTAVKLLRDGLPGKGTRWKAMRNVLIPYLKTELGHDAEGTEEILKRWTEEQIEMGHVSTSWDQCVKEIEALIRDYFPKVTGLYTKVREVDITKKEIEWIASVIEAGGTQASRDFLWTCLLLEKAYADNEGEFFASREMITTLLSKPKRIGPNTIQRSREWLSENEYLRYDVPDNYYTQRKATVYQLNKPSHVEEDAEIMDSFTFDDDTDSRALLKQIAAKLYEPKALKKLKLN
ncbi:TOTE conflict system archaeo-eukaryotic primase domain-containing protein [Salibacterium sp. K-3]